MKILIRTVLCLQRLQPCLHRTKYGTFKFQMISSDNVITTNLRDHIIVNTSKDKQLPITMVSSSSGSDERDSLEREKDLYYVKRIMSRHYNSGDYQQALESATKLLDLVVALYGKNNAVYASCLNNIALMQKHLGNYEAAIDRYIAALQLYEEVSGRFSISYASTLANIGALYKHMAFGAKGMEKQQYLDRAEEALGDAHNLRIKLHGPSHRDTLTSSIMLASLAKLRGRDQEAIESLLETLKVAHDNYGAHDILIATIENNLGFIYKCIGQFEHAKSSYERAVSIRCTTLGEKHPDSIIAIHNLAECLHASGDEASATLLQTKILDITQSSPTSIGRYENNNGGIGKNPSVSSYTAEPLTAAMMPNDIDGNLRPKPSDIVKRSSSVGAYIPPHKPDSMQNQHQFTFKSRQNIPATRKKNK